MWIGVGELERTTERHAERGRMEGERANKKILTPKGEDGIGNE